MSKISAFGPYTPVRQVGNLYFVSGQVGIDPKTRYAAKDIAAQTEQALKNLKQVLNDVGLDINKVVKTTIFLTDMSGFASMNQVYETFFEPPRPARSAVAVRELPRLGGNTPLLVEIEAVAAKADSA